MHTVIISTKTVPYGSISLSYDLNLEITLNITIPIDTMFNTHSLQSSGQFIIRGFFMTSEGITVAPVQMPALGGRKTRAK